MSSRPSGFHLATRSVTLWVGSFFLMFGIVFTTIGFQEALQEQEYREQGLTVQATVSSKSIERAKRGENSRTRYLIGYQFTTADGEAVEGMSEVSVEEWEQVKEGQAFSVTYLPHEPQSSRASDENDWIGALAFSSIGGVFVLIGGGLAVGNLRAILRTIRVAREGAATEGTVLHVGPTNTTINRVRQWRLRYRYRDHLGREQEGKSHLLSPEEGSAWHEGDTGTVRFDRQRPELSVWIGKTL